MTRANVTPEGRYLWHAKRIPTPLTCIYAENVGKPIIDSGSHLDRCQARFHVGWGDGTAVFLKE